MKSLYIFIGTEKTGTSSLQAFFRLNRTMLEQHGICYPDIGFKKGNPFHSKLVAPVYQKYTAKKTPIDFVPRGDYEVNAVWEELTEIVRKTDCDRIVVCSEHFSSRLQEDGVEEISRILAQLNIKVRIVVYLRNHFSYITSAYSTHIKCGGLSTFDEFVSLALNKAYYFDYLRMLNVWSICFGKNALIVRSYDEIKKRGSITSDALLVMGSDPNEMQLNAIERKNLSLPAELLVNGPDFNRLSKKMGVEDAVRRRMLANLSRVSSGDAAELLSLNDRQMIRACYEPDYALINRRYGALEGGVIRFPDVVSAQECGRRQGKYRDVPELLYEALLAREDAEPASKEKKGFRKAARKIVT